MKYDASDNVGIGLSYTKRLNRPSLYELDPTLVSADSLMTRKGNPDLKSEKSHVFQLTFGLWQDFNIRLGYNLNINPTYFTVVRDEENPYMHNVRYVNEPKSRSFVVSASYNKDVCRGGPLPSMSACPARSINMSAPTESAATTTRPIGCSTRPIRLPCLAN